MFDNAYSRSRPQRNPSFYISRCLFFITERSRGLLILPLFLFSLLRVRNSQWLNARTKAGLQRRHKIRSSVRAAALFIPIARSRPSQFWFRIAVRRHVRRGCDVTNLVDVLRGGGYLNFIRPRLRASFESNRLAIGARYSYLSWMPLRAVRPRRQTTPIVCVNYCKSRTRRFPGVLAVRA